MREHQGSRLGLEPTGQARLLVFSFAIGVRYKVIESPPDWVSTRAVAGNARRMNRRYVLQPGPVRGGVVLRRRGQIEANFELPPIVGVVGLRSMVESQFSAMAARIRRRAAAPGAPK